MDYTLAYRGRSGLGSGAGVSQLRFAANLARDAVAFDAELRHPLRFRECFSALHEVVVGDLRFKRRDRTSYLAWKEQEQQRLRDVARAGREQAEKRLEQRRNQPLPVGLEAEFRRLHGAYWKARRHWADRLLREDSALWRRLVPCDPVVTVADDQVLFECFSADESSYASLGVDRDAWSGSATVAPGTTNVDYSWALYEHIQGLRTYRPTRLAVAPEGISVQVGAAPAHREEKITLPPSWLAGFAQISAAALLPMQRLPLSREALYGVLSWLRRHRERQGPRALRIEARSGQPVAMVLEPWEQRIDVPGPRYDGPDLPPIRVWGRRRLLVLARILPLIETVELHLLGSGLPWFVVLRCGEMRFTLGLSGWTANDWTRSAALDLLAPPAVPEEMDLRRLVSHLQHHRAATTASLQGVIPDPSRLGASLIHLAGTGQVVHDLATGVQRWRQVVPYALGEAERGAPHPELVAARELLWRRSVHDPSETVAGPGLSLLSARVGDQDCELLIDGDGRLRRGKCGCSYFRAAGLRKGPCRHLLALRLERQRRREGHHANVWDLGRGTR